MWVLLLNAFPSPNIETPYEHINLLYQNGFHQEATTEAIAYLRDHPTDGDVRLVLAKSYVKQHDYTKARDALLTLLQTYPHYIDASLILIDMDLKIENYQDALNTVTIALISNPINPELMSKKNSILALIQNVEMATHHDDAALNLIHPGLKLGRVALRRPAACPRKSPRHGVASKTKLSSNKTQRPKREKKAPRCRNI